MEVLISLGLFASVAGSASVPYYRLKQTLQKEWLELEAHRLCQLLQVLEQQPSFIQSQWPYWESMDPRQVLRIDESWGPFEEEAMALWQIESSCFLEDQTPKRPSAKYPAWRRYMVVQRELYYQKKRVGSNSQDYGYSYCLLSRKKKVDSSAEGGNS